MLNGIPSEIPSNTNIEASATNNLRIAGNEKPRAVKVPISILRKPRYSLNNKKASSTAANSTKKLRPINKPPKSVPPLAAASPSVFTSLISKPI